MKDFLVANRRTLSSWLDYFFSLVIFSHRLPLLLASALSPLLLVELCLLSNSTSSYTLSWLIFTHPTLSAEFKLLKHVASIDFYECRPLSISLSSTVHLFSLLPIHPHVHLPLWRPQLEASRALQVQRHRKPWPCSSPMAAPTTPALSERQRRVPRPGDERTGSRPWLSSLLYPSQVPVASCSLYPVTISRFH